MTIAALAPAWSAPPPAPQTPPQTPPEETLDTWDRVSAVAGRVGRVMAKAPGFVARVVPGLLEFAIVDAVVPAVQFTAAVGGVVAFVGIGASGVLEMASGVRHRDAVKVLSGAGELSRGVFLGTVAEAAVNHLPFSGTFLGPVGHAFSYAAGGFALAAGAVKCVRAHHGGRRRERLEGLLEMGIGACSLVSTQGTLLGPAIAVQSALALTRLAVKHQDGLRGFGQRAAERLHRSWDNLRDVFRRAADH